MAPGRPRVQRVKLPIHNPVKTHRASARANHRGKNQQERAPARPAAVVARRRSLNWINIAFFRLNALVGIVFLVVVAAEVIFKGGVRPQ